MQQQLKEYLEQRIKHLNQCDADYCKMRWDSNPTPALKTMAREMSNEMMHRRQELQAVLFEIGKIEIINAPTAETIKAVEKMADRVTLLSKTEDKLMANAYDIISRLINPNFRITGPGLEAMAEEWVAKYNNLQMHKQGK